MSHGLGILNITWKRICWRLYPQYLGDVQLGHLPTTYKIKLVVGGFICFISFIPDGIMINID